VVGPKKFGKPSGPSRGLVLRLNMSNHTGSLVAQYPRSKSFDAFFLGSTQILGNGNVLVGWGSQPFFTEYSKSGKTLLDVAWPFPDLSYRVLQQSWVGTPSFPPSGAVLASKGKTTVYASWNGATKVVSWRVLAGSSKSHLSVVVKRAPKTNFETAIPVSGSHAMYEVQALSSSGQVLGTSQTFAVGSKPKLIGAY
jgi:hypothetical protein